MVVDDLRGAYNQFLKSPAGLDFIAQLTAYEAQLMTENYRKDTTPVMKLRNVDVASGIYYARTLLADCARPKSTPAPRAGRTPRPGAKS